MNERNITAATSIRNACGLPSTVWPARANGTQSNARTASRERSWIHGVDRAEVSTGAGGIPDAGTPDGALQRSVWRQPGRILRLYQEIVRRSPSKLDYGLTPPVVLLDCVGKRATGLSVGAVFLTEGGRHRPLQFGVGHLAGVPDEAGRLEVDPLSAPLSARKQARGSLRRRRTFAEVSRVRR